MANRTIFLPKNLTIRDHETLLFTVINAIKANAGGQTGISFRHLAFIDTASAVSLLNLIAFLQCQNVFLTISDCEPNTEAKRYLLDTGFFSILGILDGVRRRRATSTDFQFFEENDYNGYLYTKLTPWIEMSSDIGQNTLSVVRSALEEVFHNIYYHSGVKAGFCCAQHFPKKQEIHIAIADYGKGIPQNVRRIEPEVTDLQALELACQKGFSSRSSEHNRGVGLNLLIEQVAQKNQGSVRLQSGSGIILAKPGNDGVAILTKESSRTYYPGTLVLISLRTDTLTQFIDEADSEDFSW